MKDVVLANNTTVSVCLASYNGSTFILDQIKSILPQLNSNDELIICDDNSQDNTVSVIKSIKDARIKLVRNSNNMKAISSFENAIKYSTGDLIFLSDQDDIWPPNRVELMKKQLYVSKKYLISGNSQPIDEMNNIIPFKLGFLYRKDSSKTARNLLRIFFGKGYYYGCAMAFTKELKSFVLPFPNFIESHDLWIALIANILKRNLHLEQVVLLRRIHGKNLSLKKRSFFKKIFSRLIVLNSFIYAFIRIFTIKYGKKT